MWYDNFWGIFSANFWPEKIISRDGCFLLIKDSLGKSSLWIFFPVENLASQHPSPDVKNPLQFRAAIVWPFFTQISGRNFLPELFGRHSPRSVLCPLLYRTEHFSEENGAKRCPEKEGKEGWPSEGGKRKKGCVKRGQYWPEFAMCI